MMKKFEYVPTFIAIILEITLICLDVIALPGLLRNVLIILTIGFTAIAAWVIIINRNRVKALDPEVMNAPRTL